jgi:hypothetical protein
MADALRPMLLHRVPRTGARQPHEIIMYCA